MSPSLARGMHHGIISARMATSNNAANQGDPAVVMEVATLAAVAPEGSEQTKHWGGGGGGQANDHKQWLAPNALSPQSLPAPLPSRVAIIAILYKNGSSMLANQMLHDELLILSAF